MEQVRVHPRLWSDRELSWSVGRVVNGVSTGWVDLVRLGRESDVTLLTQVLRNPLSRELPVFSNREVRARLAPSKQEALPAAVIV